MESQSGIYKILNLINGKMYVGSAMDLHHRKLTHFCNLNKNEHINKHLQHAWNKYGEESFEFSVLEYIFDISTILQREQYWIDFYKCYDHKVGYNICCTAGSRLGILHTEESKLKISISHKALNLCGEKSATYGTIPSNETRDKIGKANRGEKNGEAILSEEQVKEIKLMIMNGNRGTEIAKKYKINPGTIGCIKSGTIWKSVEIEGFTHEDLRKKNNRAGSDNHFAKFTREEIVIIRTMFNNGSKNKEVESLFNASKSCIDGIKRGITYKDVIVPKDYTPIISVA